MNNQDVLFVICSVQVYEPFWNIGNSVFGFPPGSKFLKFAIDALFLSFALQPRQTRIIMTSDLTFTFLPFLPTPIYRDRKTMISVAAYSSWNITVSVNKYLIMGSKCFHKRFLLSYNGENICWKFICLFMIWITLPKRNKPNLNPKSQLYTLEKEITISRGIFLVLIWKYESPVLLQFHNSAWKYVIPFTDSWLLILVMYFSTDYHTARQNIIITVCFGNIYLTLEVRLG